MTEEFSNEFLRNRSIKRVTKRLLNVLFSIKTTFSFIKTRVKYASRDPRIYQRDNILEELLRIKIAATIR